MELLRLDKICFSYGTKEVLKNIDYSFEPGKIYAVVGKSGAGKIARALSYEPEIILEDEPTGNLDEETQHEIMNIFKELAAQGKCVIIVTHSLYIAEHSDVKINLSVINNK